MSDAGATFAQRLLAAQSNSEWLEVEAAAGRADRFQPQDALLDDLVRRALAGEAVLEVSSVGGDRRRPTLGLRGLNPDHRRLLDERFDLQAQQARGAWFLPEEASVPASSVNLAAYFEAQPRFAHNLADGDKGRFPFGGNPDALCCWALLAPLFAALYRPLELRGPEAAGPDREKQLAAWTEVDAFYAALGLDLGGALAPMRYGGGWSRLRVEEQLNAKLLLLESLRAAVGPGFAARYRAHRVRGLLERHQAKSKKTPAKRTQVLTKELERPLCAFFGGDWLEFLAYAGSPPHPDEAVVTALPEARLIAETGERAARIAREKGLPLEEVERALQSFWGEATAASPVEQRVAVLKRFWTEFDAIHARQAPGMPSLWGLVQEHLGDVTQPDSGGPYRPRLHESALSPELNADVVRLWGGTFLKEHPGVVVDSALPHVLVADAFGPALRFWHGAALTAWFLCEGPSSRTDMAGLREYHRRELEALEGLGCPVSAELFAELVEGEKLLGPPEEPEPDPRGTRTIPTGVDGLELRLTFSVSMGEGRRRGFERLRDTVTRHRREWAARHLEDCLRGRWQQELRHLAREHAKTLAAKGKPPPVRTFARLAQETADRWFGGNLASVYASFGERSPLEVADRRGLLPESRYLYVRAVFEELCLVFDGPQASPGEDGRVPYDSTRYGLARAAEFSLNVAQLEGALGRPPTLEEFGSQRFQYPEETAMLATEAGWAAFLDVGRRCRDLEATVRPAVVPAAPGEVRRQVEQTRVPDLPRAASEPTAQQGREIVGRQEGFLAKLLKRFTRR